MNPNDEWNKSEFMTDSRWQTGIIKKKMRLIIEICFMAYGIHHFSSSLRLRKKNSIKTRNVEYSNKIDA